MNKKVLIPIIGVVVILLLGGGFFFLSRNQPANTEDQQGFIEEEIPSLDPSEIGLEIQPRSDNRAVKLILNKAEDIDTIEFDIVYEADLSGSMKEGDGEGRVSRNVTDELTVDGESPYGTKFYDLGSCSSGKCRYDTGVTSVQVIMKVTKKDGKVFQVEDSLEL